jgi:hypothetical protein
LPIKIFKDEDLLLPDDLLGSQTSHAPLAPSSHLPLRTDHLHHIHPQHLRITGTSADTIAGTGGFHRDGGFGYEPFLLLE